MVASKKSRNQKLTRLGATTTEKDVDALEAADDAGKMRIERDLRMRELRKRDGVIHKPKRIKYTGKAGTRREPYHGKRQLRKTTLLKKGSTALTSSAFKDVYEAFHRMNASVNELELYAAFRIVLSPWLRRARAHSRRAMRNMPNFVTPYVLAVIASAYLLGDTSQPDLQRALGVRRSLWSFLEQHVPTSEKQAEQVGFRECWREGLPFSEPMVLYQNTPTGVHPLYVRLVRRWVGNPAQQVWLKPSKTIQPVGFEPVYEYRKVQEHGKEVRKRVQVNKEVNAKVRRLLARQGKQEAWRNLHKIAPEENGSHGEDSEDGDVIERVLELMGKWKRHVAMLMLGVGTEDVYDVIQVPANCCEPLMLSICPDCEEFFFTEGAFELDVTDYDALWTEKWYMKHCNQCLLARSAVGLGHCHCATLNGLNGEATNKDDVKGRGKGKGRRGKNKSKGKRSNTQLVIVRNNSRRLANAPRPATNLYEKQYRLALFDPFNPHARGAKCTVYPWQYTVPFTVRWKARVQVSANGNNMMIFQPNPSFYGWTTVFNAVTTSIEPVLGPIAQVPWNSAVGLNGALVSNFTGTSSPVYEPAISQSLANFRVVAGGICLRSILRNNVGQGLSVAVPVLMQNTDFAWTDVVSTDYFNRSNASGGTYWTENQSGCNFVQQSMLGSTYNNTNILTMGGAASFTTYDLMMNEAVMRFTPVTPEAFKFHDCGYENPSMLNTAGVIVGPGDIATYDMTTYNVQDVAKRGITDCDGWSGVLLRNTNTSTAMENFYEIDYVLHIEGQPRMSGGPPPAMGSDIPPTPESVILSYARDIKNIVIESISHAAATAGRAGVQAALNNLQAAVGGTTRARARIL